MSDYFEDRTPSAKKVIDIVLDRAKSILQIAALLLAGAWAVWRFDLFESPELEHRARLDGNVDWQERSDEACIGWFNLKFENIGKRSIMLESLTLSVWPFDPGQPDSPLSYVDVVDRVKETLAGRLAQKGMLEVKETPVKSVPTLVDGQNIVDRFTARYPPGVSDKTGLMFIAKRAPGKMLVFMAEGKSRPAGGTKVEPWYFHQVEYVCGESGYKSRAAELATQVRLQGHRCEGSMSTEQPKPDEPIWILKCANATYRVRIIPDTTRVERLQ